MIRLSAALAVLLAAAPALAFGDVHGDGHKTTEARSVPPFSEIRLEGSLDVAVEAGATQSVAVTIDGNLQPEVETRVEGKALVISTRHGISYRGEGRVRIVVPALSALAIDGSGDAVVAGVGTGDVRLSIAGSGDVRWSGLAAEALRTEIAGSGDVQLSGTAAQLDVAIRGSGDVRAADLVARSARVRVDGSGDVVLHLGGGSLDAEVNGSGDVLWSGEAKVERTSVAGSGDIRKR